MICLKSIPSSRFYNRLSHSIHKKRTFLNSKKLKSALDNLPILKGKNQQGTFAGRVAFPFTVPPFKNLHVDPLGLVP